MSSGTRYISACKKKNPSHIHRIVVYSLLKARIERQNETKDTLGARLQLHILQLQFGNC